MRPCPKEEGLPRFSSVLVLLHVDGHLGLENALTEQARTCSRSVNAKTGIYEC